MLCPGAQRESNTGRMKCSLTSLSLWICWYGLVVFPHLDHKKWKVEWEAQTGMCQWSTLTFKTSCRCTAQNMPEWRETTKQVDRQAKQSSQVTCFLEDLRWWEAWDTTCGHKAKDITPLIAWRREALQEEVLDNLSWEDERGPSSIRQTLELFQRQRWGNFWEMGWSTCGLFRAHRYHFELNWSK